MKYKSSTIWLFAVLFAVLVVDAYYQISEATQPVWTTEWFWTRIVVIAVILTGALFYYLFRQKKRHGKQTEEIKRKLAEAQEVEWKKIAGELHDNIGQNLSAINILLQSNIKKLPNGIEEKEQFTYASEIIQETIEDIRSLSTKIYPQQIERLGLTVAISSLFEKLSASTGIHFNFKTDNIDNVFSNETQLNFYRIIQETTNNIIKHSRASEVEIEISKHILFVTCSIKDNGIGFDMNRYISSDVSKLGFGLLNLEERIRIVNGDYKVQSQPDKGTSMTFTIPCLRQANR